MAMLNLTLVKSTIGCTQKQLATAEALGLRKIGDITAQPDSPATRGKIRVLAHLLKVEEGGAA